MGEEDMQPSPEQVQQAIRDLLEICKAKNVEIPAYLNASLLHAIGEETHAEELVPIKERISHERTHEVELFEDSTIIKEYHELQQRLGLKRKHISLRVKDGSFKVINYYDDSSGPKSNKQKIATVFNSTPTYAILQKLKRVFLTKKLCDNLRSEERNVMSGVNLSFESGKMYLILGAPGCGKSTLLKMIAGILQKDKDHIVGGTVTANQLAPDSKGVVWTNLVSYIDQIDRLHPWLTVKETCEFSWRCRSGGTHRTAFFGVGDEIDEEVKKLDEALWTISKVLEGLGLARVVNTFVGDQQTVRGVSGGEKRRVTVAEMAVTTSPIMCADEISTGLDAATTYDIIQLMGGICRLNNSIKVVSLLQPPPETFALFDGLILLSEGKVIYSGQVDQVVQHFESLGYSIPDRMDVADWLQAIPTKEGQQFFQQQDGKVENARNPTTDELSELFYASELGKGILSEVEAPETNNNDFDDATKGLLKKWVSKRYRNSWYESLKLLSNREMLLWWRDQDQIKARVAQDLVMGIIAGTLFWQGSDDPTSVMGILFQSMFFVSLGAMLKIPAQYTQRSIFYKQQDANFFPTSTFVLGRSLSGVPASIIDGIVFGTVIFWFVGLAHNDGASIANYFMFVFIILVTSLTAGLVFSILSAVTRDRTMGQACMAILVIIMVLFSGFVVQPNVIPDYWIWVYWGNFFAWSLRALAVNEFDSGKYDEPSGIDGMTVGQVILSRFGFVDGKGDTFDFEWTWWSILFLLMCSIVSLVVSTYFLSSIRFAAGKSLGAGFEADDDDGNEEKEEDSTIDLPFQKVDLTFKDIRYTVTSSVGKEQLELLKGVDGIVEGGKMTALMGSSGAGKTTLMDVLALRKSSGEIEGEIRLNGHLQDPISFRRCTGYVEQFDVQSAQLTVRETCEFSAKLRLESSDPAVTPDSTIQFVNQTLAMLELTQIQDLQVGDDDGGGLSFEQRKRLGIAVELVSNPSIIFLDEPTSGLDARAASIVMRGLKRIAQSGRAVCATIHQPSIAIFNSFDALLLLKRGGETVFFGDLGEESKNLINYFERYDASPRIQPGDNPATWMLTAIGAGNASTDKKPFDYAGSFQVSELHKDCVQRIAKITESASDERKVSFPTTHATSLGTQRKETVKRVILIYWRSPSYNTIRLISSVVIALLFGSIYVSSRTPTTEADMSSRATTIFIAFIFLGVNAQNTVLSVFENERNMFYRHKEALMYTNQSVLAAFTLAEIPFVLLSSMVFVVIFYFMLGFAVEASKFFLFYLFFTLNLGLWTFVGQMLVSLNRDAASAQGFGGLLISLTALFTGILIRPYNIPNFWIFMYWVVPGHYVFEGLLVSQYNNDMTPIIASPNTPFWESLNCQANYAAWASESGTFECVGPAEQWVDASFGGIYKPEHLPWNILYLVGVIIASRVITGIALAKLNYRRT